MNRGPDVPLPWSLHETVLLPPELDGEVRFTEIAAPDVGADAEGRVYVLDESGGRVVVFGRTGRVVGVVGRAGQGPGELAEPVALGVSAAGDVAVYDWGAGGVRRWNIAGERSLERLEEPFWGPGLGVAPWGLVYPSIAEDGPDARVVRLAVQGDSRTGFLTGLTQPLVQASFPSCGLVGWSMTPIFTPELLWSSSGDVVLAATGPEYGIQVFEGGALTRTIARDLPPAPASSRVALRAAGEGLEITAPFRCRVPPEEVVEGRGFAEVVPAISGLRVAPDGTTWVRRGPVADDGHPPIDVLDGDGAYMGTLPSGTPFPIAFAGSGREYRAVSIRTSELGVSEIVIHRIDRSVSGVEGGPASGS